MMILSRIPEKYVEAAGTVAGFLASATILLAAILLKSPAAQGSLRAPARETLGNQSNEGIEMKETHVANQRRTFNVLNYGAVGDDKTDNTAAFSAIGTTATSVRSRCGSMNQLPLTPPMPMGTPCRTAEDLNWPARSDKRNQKKPPRQKLHGAALTSRALLFRKTPEERYEQT